MDPDNSKTWRLLDYNSFFKLTTYMCLIFECKLLTLLPNTCCLPHTVLTKKPRRALSMLPPKSSILCTTHTYRYRLLGSECAFFNVIRFVSCLFRWSGQRHSDILAFCSMSNSRSNKNAEHHLMKQLGLHVLSPD